MNIFEIMKTFPADEACLEYLEDIRWHGNLFVLTAEVLKSLGKTSW